MIGVHGADPSTVGAVAMTEQPDLFSITDDDALTYNGTAGAVNQPASQQRAKREATSGAATERARLILAVLAELPQGATWKQLGAVLGLHHGQVSGALSNLHKSGHVFMLHQQRDKCHLYCHAQFRVNYTTDERIDEPAQTKAGKRNQDIQQLLDAITVGITMGRIKDNTVERLVKELKETE
jgi:hypothetical protein